MVVEECRDEDAIEDLDEVEVEDVAEVVTKVALDVFVVCVADPLVVEELCVDTIDDEVIVLNRTESVDTIEDEVTMVLEDTKLEPF